MNGQGPIDTSGESLSSALSGLEGLEDVREALAGLEAYLVGGAVRDLLLGGQRADLDVCIVGELDPALRALDAEVLSAGRFQTAVAWIGGLRVDLARARRESYAEPGALPDVEPAGIEEDLGRRDFTVNAMAITLAEPAALVDPFGGLDDLAAGLLRALHQDSFLDDPTRALRGARYAARYGFGFDPETEAGLRSANLDSVSTDRAMAEIRRCADEQCEHGALLRCADLGLVEVPAGAADLCATACKLLASEPWSGLVAGGGIDPASVLIACAGIADGHGDVSLERARVLANASVRRPSDALEITASTNDSDLLVADALGAGWTEPWVREWRGVRLEISGEDLIAAGVDAGPEIGRGLQAALRAKLDGAVSGRGGELEVAMRAIDAGGEA